MAENRDTPVTYSKGEAVKVREIVGDASHALECPLCGGELKIGVPIASRGTGDPVWEIRCEGCKRAAYANTIDKQHQAPSEP